MSNTDSQNIISFRFIQFPQHLIVKNVENTVSMEMVSESTTAECFRLFLKGENLEIKFLDGFKDEFELNSSQKKTVKANLIPTRDGFGKLTIELFWLKKIEYTAEVQKVREKLPEGILSRLFSEYEVESKEEQTSFNYKKYFNELSKSGLKGLEKRIEEIEELLESNESEVSKNASKGDLLLELDESIKNLAYAYLSRGGLKKAIEILQTLKDNDDKKTAINNLIRAFAYEDLEAIISFMDDNKLNFEANDSLRGLIAIDQAESNPELSYNIITKIENEKHRKKILKSYLNVISKSHPQICLKYVNQLDNLKNIIQIMVNITKSHLSKEEEGDALKVGNKMVQICRKNLNKESIKILRDSLILLAEVDSPSKSDEEIEKIENQEFKAKIETDLLNILYKTVEETRTKIEPTSVVSQYFHLNSYSSNSGDNIRNFALYNGNVSSNLLMDENNYTSVFISPFGFNFTIFPIIDRMYSEFRFSNNQLMGYYIFPSKDLTDDKEQKILTQTLSTFIKSKIHSLKEIPIIYNLDFIQYLGKPTVIFGTIPQNIEWLRNKLSSLNNQINIIYNKDIFYKGKIFNDMKEILQISDTQIINLVLSYEFLNDYESFKKFIETLIKKK
ncbi:MAG: hypothetical protein GF317_11880 [Candidatus Lokiarchaeota archaeon]|nr:hypothetical protein [Candidatus Lokiarchaeota archaeon]MBD3200346.1 hypothetical protein [Candidatus Lokiarchaeota archaeon]